MRKTVRMHLRLNVAKTGVQLGEIQPESPGQFEQGKEIGSQVQTLPHIGSFKGAQIEPILKAKAGSDDPAQTMRILRQAGRKHAPPHLRR